MVRFLSDCPHRGHSDPGGDHPPSAGFTSADVYQDIIQHFNERAQEARERGDEAEALRAAGNEYGTTTGRPRRAGWFDAVAVRYAIELCGADGWIATKLDVLTGLPELSVAVAYQLGETRFDRFPAHLASIDELVPVYEVLPGWEEDISGIRSFSALPDNARSYLERLEQLVGAPVEMVSVGPARDAVIQRGS